MTKIKTLGATVLLVAAFAAPVFAQDAGRARRPLWVGAEQLREQ